MYKRQDKLLTAFHGDGVEVLVIEVVASGFTPQQTIAWYPVSYTHLTLPTSDLV